MINSVFIKNLVIKNKQNKEIFWASIAKFISLISGLLILLLVPKYGGSEIFGAFSLLIAYQIILGIFWGSSVQMAVRKEITEGKFNDLSKAFFWEGLRIKIVLSIIGSLLLFFLLQIIDVSIFQNYLGLFLVLIFIINLWGAVAHAFEATHRLFYEAVIYAVEYIIKIGIIIYFLENLSVNILLISFIAGYAGAFFVGMMFLINNYKINWSKDVFFINRDNVLRILKRSFYLSLTSLSLVILSKFDSVMISYFLNIKSVGLYNIGSNIAKELSIISMPIIIGVVPLFISKAGEKKLLYASIKKIIFINILIFFILYFGSSFIVDLFYGDEFYESIGVIKILSLFPLLASLQSLMQYILVLKDKTKEIFFFGLMVVFLNIILNIFFIPTYGIVGAAISTIVAYFTWLIVCFNTVRRLFVNNSKITFTVNK